MAQFSKFVRPGDTRIDATYNPQSGIYFSTSVTTQTCTKAATEITGTISTDIITNDIVLFPNPFTSEITLQDTEESILSIEVYNQLGKLVLNIPGNHGKDNKIKFGKSLVAGIYFVKVNRDNKTDTYKIVKQ